MSLSASEFYKAGMSLPPSVRKDVALRLLESVEPDEAFDRTAEVASAEIAQQFVSAILDHIDGILVFPLAGRARDDVRPGNAVDHLQEEDPRRLRA